MKEKKTNQTALKKAVIGIITASLLLALSIPGWAADYLIGFIGPGHQEYLHNKIRQGYYVEVFADLDIRQKEQVQKKNQLKALVFDAYQANVDSAYGILEHDYQRAKNAQVLNWTIRQDINRNKQVAATNTEFKYIKHSDGKIVRFTNGLVTSIENERIVDQFGNVSIRDTFNMEYNDKRLLTGYEASISDSLGNVTQIYCYGIEYTDDSVFYGGYGTSAPKNARQERTARAV